MNVWFGRTRAPRAPRAAPLRRRGRGRPQVRHGDCGRSDVEADDRRVLVHRMRPLPGRLPGARDREDPLAEAPDHGRPRPGVRRRQAALAGGELRRSSGTASRGDGLGLRDLRRLRRGVPGLDRARRPHRRPAPPPGDGRLALPRRGRADAARRRAGGEPVGQAAGRAGGVGRRASACACSSRAIPRRRSSTGSAAPRRSTSAREPRPSRPRSCCRRRASTSRSSARASRAPATRPGGWATSTSSRRSPSRTSRR